MFGHRWWSTPSRQWNRSSYWVLFDSMSRCVSHYHLSFWSQSMSAIRLIQLIAAQYLGHQMVAMVSIQCFWHDGLTRWWCASRFDTSCLIKCLPFDSMILSVTVIAYLWLLWCSLMTELIMRNSFAWPDKKKMMLTDTKSMMITELITDDYLSWSWGIASHDQTKKRWCWLILSHWSDSFDVLICCLNDRRLPTFVGKWSMLTE